MPAYKDAATNTWYANFYYTDWTGKKIHKKKRGFSKKKEALDFERNFLNKQSRGCDLTFSNLVDIYLEDMDSRLKASTMNNRKHMIRARILPYFENLKLEQITPADVRKWQTILLSSDFSPTYIKAIHEQLSALFSYAVKYYNLSQNPCAIAGSIGKSKAKQMEFWTLDEFNQFIQFVDKEPTKVAFEMLFWTGIRIGELLALTQEDFNFEKNTVSITKSYQRLSGKDVITEPKTPKSNRTIPIPIQLSVKIQSYINSLPSYQSSDRLWTWTRKFLDTALISASKKAGLKKIRIHDLRHSHASLLIEMDTPILLVSERLGHENIKTTLQTYSHLYPTRQAEVASKLNNLMELKRS